MSTSLTARIEEWRSQLLDTSKRNRLINLSLGRTGAVKLVHPATAAIWTSLVEEGGTMSFPTRRSLVGGTDKAAAGGKDEDDSFPSLADSEAETEPAEEVIPLEDCLASRRLRADHILTDLADKPLQSRLGRLSLNAKTALTEQGVPTLYVAFGLLKWFESPESQAEILSPLLLFPAALERESVDAPWELRLLEDDVVLNHALEQLMRNSFKIELPGLPEDQGEGEPAEWRTRYFEDIRQAIRHQKRWEILDECVLGIFTFQKIAMWDDLGKNRDLIIEHDLCRAVAGDRSRALPVPEGLPTARELDAAVRPAVTYHILDSDSSQHEAIEAAKRGASLVLDGPPGTGKSQTIANIIAEFLAAGKTVLFVSEKAAALEVVKRRLDKRGLGDFCLECHSHKANKKEITGELGRCLSLPAETYPDHERDLDRLYQSRGVLNAYVQSLHEVRQPLGLSAFQVHGRLAALPAGPKTVCPVPNAGTMTGDDLRRIEEMLKALPDCRDAVRDQAHHPWRGLKQQRSSLNLKADLDRQLEQLDEGLTRIRAATPLLTKLELAPAEMSVPAWSDLVALIDGSLKEPTVPAEWFAGDPRATAQGYIQLDKLTLDYRQTRQDLAEFAEAAVLGLDAEALKSLTAAAASPAAELRLRPHDHPTVRGLRTRLDQIQGPLRAVAERVQAAGGALTEVLATLGLKPRPIPARGLDQIQKLLGLAGTASPIRRAWLDQPWRERIRTEINRCREYQRLDGETRAGLFDRLRPAAFEAGPSAELAERSRSFRAGWKRVLLLPWWWRLRGRLAALYEEAAPPTPQLLADMANLADYHRRTRYVAQIQQKYHDMLEFREDGGADWDKTEQGLKACEQFEPLLKVYPELKDMLASAEGFSRPGLPEALQRFTASVRSYQEAAEAVGSFIDLTPGLGAEGDPSSRTLDDFTRWLQQQQGALERSIARLDQTAALLQPDRDLPLEALPQRMSGAAKLREDAGRIQEAAAALKLGEEPAAIRERDWTDTREKAEWTIGFLDRQKDGPPPPALVRLVTHPEIRDEAAQAVQANLAARTDAFQAGWNFLTEIFDPGEPVSTGIQFDTCSLDALHEWVQARRRDTGRVDEWIRFRDLRGQIIQAGYSVMLPEILDGKISVDDAASAFLARFYGAWLDAVHASDPALSHFSTAAHERLVGDFRKLDEDAIRLSYTRIREARLGDPNRPRAAALDAPSSSELGTLLREVNKKRRHLPLRQLFARIPTVLLRVKPCVMMSPLAVSTYLDSSEIRFDVVIFDEGSQVRPFDAISSIYRGRQLIVAGDQKQLPPTSFFERGAADEDDSADGEEAAETLADFESILDVCCTLGIPRRRLRWHYRSRREPLIAFSNRHFYESDLVTFPSVLDTPENPAVRFEYLPDARWKAGAGGGYNASEALRTAELVMRHFQTSPERSLGVIAFSQRQQVAILDALERLRRADSSLEGHFSDQSEEPFFVKNLENVQGDERDVIFLSVGYGPDEQKRVAMRFGPLNRQGGERRLNVAITRARHAMTVISSLKAQDIDLARTQAEGAKLLRAYLDYAERGVAALGSEVTAVNQNDFDSPFEEAVAQALSQRGLEVRRQVGCSGYRIDLALVDPKRPGRFVVGIECDGATYHNSATARDRDRLRQEVLENLGWTMVRIWSTDWMKDSESQIKRVVDAYERALAADPPSAATEPESAETKPRNEDKTRDEDKDKVETKTKTKDDPETETRAKPETRAKDKDETKAKDKDEPETEDDAETEARRPADETPVTTTDGGSAAPAPPTFHYHKIDEVPPADIDRLILSTLEAYGATDQGELTSVVARGLGFQRTGPKIKERITDRLEDLLGDNRIVRAEEDRVRLNPDGGPAVA